MSGPVNYKSQDLTIKTGKKKNYSLKNNKVHYMHATDVMKNHNHFVFIISVGVNGSILNNDRLKTSLNDHLQTSD